MNYTVSVRELCEFTAKSGDLDLRFTPAPSAQEGIAGHAVVTARRGAGYQRELRLENSYKCLQLRGRADGFDPHRNELEEIKTHRGALHRIPENHRQLHWAQLKIYGAQLCEAQGLAEIRLTLVYFEVDRQKETPISEIYSAETLQSFFNQQCELFLKWAEQQLAHKTVRDTALEQVSFPHADFHAGQRQLAEAVYRAAGRKQALLVQAPTGIGKSIGTLFPALKAVARQQLDKIFYLTAKTSGRQLALDAAASLVITEGVLPLRVLELVAREKCCEHPDKACHGDSCPLAKGFYDRLPAAREAAMAGHCLDQAAVREVARQHQVCPYYLSQDLARWSDVVVGDYNYYFDQSALLHGLTVLNEWRVGVLVDEAHNLIERGRAMYSAELDQQQLNSLRHSAAPAIKQTLDRVHRAWNRCCRDQAIAYKTYPSPPAPLLESLHKAVAALGDLFAENPSAPDRDLQRFYFDALNFLGLAEQFGEHSMFDVQLRSAPRGRSHANSVLCIRNIVPAPFLARRLATATSTVAFSATLNPAHFYRDMLGFPAETPWLDVASPFSADQLSVKVVSRISTRYQHRAASLAPIADLIAEQFRYTPGNYLAFFSSYDYLQQVAGQLAARHFDIPFWQQDPRMAEADRTAFLSRFTAGSQGVGFAVLGGAFAEGIDLVGSRLIGAFVATLGLPQVNPVTEEMRQRMQTLFGSGYDYAYLYPGLQKVVQAAGRVIRTRTDRGIVFLVDDRFSQAKIRNLLPSWWSSIESEARLSAPV